MTGRRFAFARSSAAVAAGFLALGAIQAVAADRVVVRLGMSMAEIEPYLKSACEQLEIGGKAEKYVTCWLSEGRLITATLTKKDRVVYSVFRQPGRLHEVEAFASSIAAELGFAGAGESCMVYSDPSFCWKKGTAEFWVYRDPDSQGRMSSFQRDETMDNEDK